MIRVLISDDHPVVRAGLKAMLDQCEDIEVVGEVSTPQDAVDFAATHANAVDVVLMDLRFGEAPSGESSGGVWATQQIRAREGAPQVLVVTNYSTDADVVGAVSAGAVGYLLKDCGAEELAQGVRTAARGETVMNHAVMDTLLGRMRQPVVALTPREVEVLQRAAEGASNREIARALILTEATVKSHMGNVFTKLGVSNRTAAVNTARQQGLIA